MKTTKTAKVQSSRVEDGIEICNTCCKPADTPYRYKTSDGSSRACVASCHDTHVRHNTKPSWMAPRYVLPKWITEARKAIVNFERVQVS